MGYKYNPFTAKLDRVEDITGKMDVDGLNSDITYLNFNPTTAPTYQQGRVWYDNQSRSLSYYDEHSGTSIQVGKEIVMDVRNDTGATITDGKVVYISGAAGQHPTIALARANSESTSEIIGVTTHNIPNNTVGKVTLIGNVNDIDTSAFTDGAPVFLSATTAGELTDTIPVSPDFSVQVGTIAYAHPTQGILVVHPEHALANNNALGTSQHVGATQNAIKTYVDNAVAAASTTLLSYIDQSGGTSDTYGVLAGLINGSNTVYTVSQSEYRTGTLTVYLNGQLQTQGSSEDWVETTPASGTFTFAIAPLTGDLITVEYSVGTPTELLENVVLAKTTNYTITGSEATAEITILASNTITITLPASAVYTNRFINIKNVGTGIITIEGNASETIDGDLTKTISFTYTTVRLTSDGNNFYII